MFFVWVWVDGKKRYGYFSHAFKPGLDLKLLDTPRKARFLIDAFFWSWVQ
jgi:hypothetical protein